MNRPLWVSVLLVALGLHGCGGGSAEQPRPDRLAGATWVVGATPSSVVQGERIAAQEFRLLDADGRPLAGIPAEISADGGGTVVPAAATTDADGRVTLAWTAGASLNQQHLEIHAGTVLARATVWVERAPPGPATAVTVIAGNQQTVLQHRALAAPLIVRVVDAFGNGVPNVPVTFSVAPASAAFATSVATSASSPDNAVGTALLASAWLNSAGDQIIEATVAGAAPARLAVTVLPNPQVFDGRFSCRMFNVTFERQVTLDIVDGVVLAPFLPVISGGYPTYDLKLAEGTGTLTGFIRWGTEASDFDFNATVDLLADDAATISGTYTNYISHRDEIDGAKPGVLKCVRQ